MDERCTWSLEELVRRAGQVLAGSARTGGYAGPPNGRVRGLPDQRSIRWYITTGLLDRPAGGRGRGASYGARHLRQLVAIKLLQSEGLPLAEIQSRLAGISDAELAALAPLPAEALAAVPPERGDGLAERGGGLAERGDGRLPQVDGTASGRFWAAAPAAPRRPAPAGAPSPSPSPSPVPSPVPPSPSAVAGSGAIAPLAGVWLAPGAFLVLPVTPAPADLPALAEAARPLLAALAARGLVPATSPSAEPTEEGAPA